jgi:hypothetical protein
MRPAAQRSCSVKGASSVCCVRFDQAVLVEAHQSATVGGGGGAQMSGRLSWWSPTTGTAGTRAVPARGRAARTHPFGVEYPDSGGATTRTSHGGPVASATCTSARWLRPRSCSRQRCSGSASDSLSLNLNPPRFELRERGAGTETERGRAMEAECLGRGIGGGASLPRPPGFAVSVGAVCGRDRRLYGWPRLARPNGQTTRDRLRDCPKRRAGRG